MSITRSEEAIRSEPVLLEETRNAVRILRLNRPEKSHGSADRIRRADRGDGGSAGHRNPSGLRETRRRGYRWHRNRGRPRDRHVRRHAPGQLRSAVSFRLCARRNLADGFDQAFVAYCEKIGEVAPLAARQTKRLVTRFGFPEDLEAHLRDELAYARLGLASDDGKEAVRAIFQKRKPVFTGR